MSEHSETWHDASNWMTVYGRRVVYNAPDDPRVLVPKQPLAVEVGRAKLSVPMGWTFNMAHTESKMLMSALVGILPCVLVLVRTRRP